MEREWIVYFTGYNGIERKMVNGFDINEAIMQASNAGTPISQIVCVKQKMMDEAIAQG